MDSKDQDFSIEEILDEIHGLQVKASIAQEKIWAIERRISQMRYPQNSLGEDTLISRYGEEITEIQRNILALKSLDVYQQHLKG